MSVYIDPPQRLHQLFASAQALGLSPARELFIALHGATFVAHLLSYDTLPDVRPYNAAETFGAPETLLGPQELMRALQAVFYNTVSNGGNFCLGAGAHAEFQALQLQLAPLALQESGYCHVLGQKIIWERRALPSSPRPQDQQDAYVVLPRGEHHCHLPGGVVLRPVTVRGPLHEALVVAGQFQRQVLLAHDSDVPALPLRRLGAAA
ncbi:hypothetical protein ACINK0_18850 (plasmid) [Deinococcus sp. VB343]|uniref:Uncharacterized protein n=1 Tax=Deinococcus sp. VB142 TaxID=3112952 RepID=A0AAU6Q7L9_9DEIO